MNLDNLFKLIDAGFTKADIMQLMNAPAPAPDNQLAQVLAQMTQTLQSIQAANIGNSNNQPPKDNDSVVNDYLASIINPTYNNNGGNK